MLGQDPGQEGFCVSCYFKGNREPIKMLDTVSEMMIFVP